MSIENLRIGLPPVGKYEPRVERVVGSLELLHSYFRSAILDAFIAYQQAVVHVIEEHNQHTNISLMASPESFKNNLRLLYDDFGKQDEDLLADLIIDIKRAEDDE